MDKFTKTLIKNYNLLIKQKLKFLGSIAVKEIILKVKMKKVIQNFINKSRIKYLKFELDETKVDVNPFNQFEIWFNAAIETEINNPTAMTISTCKDNIPSSRVVLLKEFNETGFIFFTNYESKKGKEISSNLNVSLNFYWKVLGRQIRIDGTCKKISSAESKEYFDSRPFESRIGAWASKQSSIIQNRKFLDDNFLSFKKKFENKNIPLPKYWGGYKIIPFYFEFWQEKANRLHDRISYQKKRREWKIIRLSP